MPSCEAPGSSGRSVWNLAALVSSAVRRSATLAVIVCLAATAAWPVSAKDWSQFRGPNRENRSEETGLSTDWEKSPPKLLYSITGMGGGYGSVAVVGPRAYVVGNRDNSQCLVAIDLPGKTVAWAAKLTDGPPQHSYDGSRSTPTIDGDVAYVVSSNGAISAVGTAKGEILWQKDFQKEWNGRMMSGWGFSESPLVDGDLVLCTPGSEDAMVVALNKKTGETVWKSAVKDEGSAGTPGAGYASLIVGNGGGVKQYVTLIGRGVIGIRASDGKLLWRYNRVANTVANIPTPIVNGDYVFCSSGYGDGGTALVKLAAKDGGVSATEVYYHPAGTMQNHHGGMVRVGDYVYFGNGHNNGFPICVKLDSGKIEWGGKLRGPGQESACVTFADGHIIFRYQSGDVGIVEATPKSYRLKGSFTPEVVNPPSWSHPVVSGKKLFLREQDTLMVYDLSK